MVKYFQIRNEEKNIVENNKSLKSLKQPIVNVWKLYTQHYILTYKWNGY